MIILSIHSPTIHYIDPFENWRKCISVWVHAVSFPQTKINVFFQGYKKRKIDVFPFACILHTATPPTKNGNREGKYFILLSTPESFISEVELNYLFCEKN